MFCISTSNLNKGIDTVCSSTIHKVNIHMSIIQGGLEKEMLSNTNSIRTERFVLLHKETQTGTTSFLYGILSFTRTKVQNSSKVSIKASCDSILVSDNERTNKKYWSRWFVKNRLQEIPTGAEKHNGLILFMLSWERANIFVFMLRSYKPYGKW